MKITGIQARVMLIALLPTLIMAVTLSAFHARSRMAEFEQAVLTKGRAVARQLAPGSEFGVVSGNFTLLGSIAASALQDDDFVRIVIRDHQGTPILDRIQDDEPGAARDWLSTLAAWMHPVFSDHQSVVSIRAPIYRIVIPVTDTFEPEPPAPVDPQVVGWIDLEVSLLDASRNQLIVLMESLSIVLGALAAAGLAGRYVGRGVVRPIRAITTTVRRITLGDLNSRVRIRADGELGQLATGVNQMAEKVSFSHKQLHAEIDKATSELKATMAELEKRSVEIDDARREAVRVSDFKSQFLANVSHEIRTPMNAILGFTELLARSSTDPVQKEFLDTILSSASSLLALLNEILDLSRIESGRMDLDAVETDIGAIINEVYQLYLPQAMQKNLEFFARSVEPDLARVLVDPLRLKQVLVNLISNALKFTDDGYVLIRTTVNSATPDRLDIQFSVEDTGCGIAKETQRKLFRAFSQGDMSTTRSHGGSGLGLHIASELVFLMGGEITLESAPGLGSNFSFNLSLQRSRVLEASEQAAAETTVETLPKRPPILLTNAYPPFQKMLRESLNRAGFDVVTPDEADFAGDRDWLCILDYRTSQSNPRLEHNEIIEDILTRRQPPVLAWIGGLISDTRPSDRAWRYQGFVARTPEIGQLRHTLLSALAAPADRDLPQPVPVEDQSLVDRNARLLVVDDHPLNLRLVDTLLAGTGYSAVCVESAAQALELAAKETFDALLLDLHMPHKDGFTLASEVRAGDGPCHNSVIIALTADAYPETAQRAQAVGMDDILVKPINQQRLLSMLDQWLAIRNHRPLKDSSYQSRPVHAENMDDLSREMRAVLVRMLPMHRAELEDSYKAGNWDEMRLQVHKLRGATAYCGVPALTRGLTRLQSLLDKNADTDQVISQYRSCREMIDAEIERGNAGGQSG